MTNANTNPNPDSNICFVEPSFATCDFKPRGIKVGDRMGYEATAYGVVTVHANCPIMAYCRALEIALSQHLDSVVGVSTSHRVGMMLPSPKGPPAASC